MFQKCAQAFMAAVLALSFSPFVAFAEDMTAGSPEENALQTRETSSLSLYSQSLTAPPLSSQLDDLASAADIVNGGILLGSGGNLYYLREASFKVPESASASSDAAEGGDADYDSGDSSDTDASNASYVGAYKTLERYNIASGTWDVLASLPEWLEYCSAVISPATSTQEGQLVLVGTPMDLVDGIPCHAANPTAEVYTYNFGDEYPAWTLQLDSSAQVPVASALVNNAGQLELVGGISNGSPTGAISSYDIKTGTITSIGTLDTTVVGAEVQARSGALYVYSYASSLEDLKNGTGTPRLSVFDKNLGDEGSAGLPAFVQPSISEGYPSSASIGKGSLASSDAGIFLVGPETATGNDTFLLEWETSSFEAYSQNLANRPVSGAAASVYMNALYGLGSTITDDNEVQMVFRSTAQTDGQVKSGDNGVWRQNSGVQLVFEFTPDYGRFKHIVSIDGSDLIESVDYESTAGSTIVSLNATCLDKLSLGEHTLTAYFDDKNTQISAKFTVEADATSAEEGVLSPSSLAATSDTIPAIPLIIVSVCTLTALSVVYTIIRRKSV